MRKAIFEVDGEAVAFLKSVATLTDRNLSEVLQMSMGTLKIIVDAQLAGKAVLIVDPITDEAQTIVLKS